MPSVIQSPFSPVLSALKAQLVSGTGLPAYSIKVALREREPHFQGDADLIVVVSGPSPEVSVTDSAGRVDLELIRTVTVRIRVRLASDPSDSDDAILTDPTFGLLVLEELVLNALVSFWPEDSDGNALLREPVHVVPSPPPTADPLPDRGWAESRLSFDVRYVFSADQSVLP